MAKDIALIFIIFFSISGICFYKWIMIHTRIKQMDLIKCQVTDVINRTTYQKIFMTIIMRIKLITKNMVLATD